MSKPWDVMKGETAKAYHAFVMYRSLGPTRTLRAAREKFEEEFGSVNVNSVENWSSNFNWPERALEWDSYEVEASVKAAIDNKKKVLAAVAREEERRIRRTANFIERAFDRASEMLEYPIKQMITEEVIPGEDGKTTIVKQTYEPVRWQLRDAAMMVQVAQKMQAELIQEAKDSTIDTSQETLEKAGKKLEEFRRQAEKEVGDLQLMVPGSYSNPVEVTPPEQ